MSAIKYSLPSISEIESFDTLALSSQKTIFPFYVGVKKIKIVGLSLIEKYPYQLETQNGFTYSVINKGKTVANIQLSNETGLEIKGDKRNDNILKLFFLDPDMSLYRSLINQLTKSGNNQLFILCLGLKAMKLTTGDINTVNLIDSPTLSIIEGEQWIKLVTEVIGDIAWGYFDASVRPGILANFENRLRQVIDLELSLLGVHIPSLEKEVSKAIKAISASPEVTEAIEVEVTEETKESETIEAVVIPEAINPKTPRNKKD